MLLHSHNSIYPSLFGLIDFLIHRLERIGQLIEEPMWFRHRFLNNIQKFIQVLAAQSGI